MENWFKKIIIISLLITGLYGNGNTLKIMIMDSGADLNNPEISKWVPHNWNNESNQDKIGHGTNVFSIISAKACRGVQIIPCKYYEPVLFNFFNDNLKREKECIKKAIEEKVDILHLSGGGLGFNSEEKGLLFVFLSNKSRKFVTSSGNEGMNLNNDCSYYPACYRLSNQIVVGGVDDKGDIENKSNRGSFIEYRLWTTTVTDLNNEKTVKSGTSMSAAIRTRELVENWCNQQPR